MSEPLTPIGLILTVEALVRQILRNPNLSSDALLILADALREAVLNVQELAGPEERARLDRLAELGAALEILAPFFADTRADTSRGRPARSALLHG